MVLFSSVGAFTVPAWQSLMSDYIPVKKRGKYFGWRNKVQGAVAIPIRPQECLAVVMPFVGGDAAIGWGKCAWVDRG